MSDAAISRRTQLENRLNTTEDELKRAKLRHQRTYQAYKDLVMQDQDQSSDTEYPKFVKQTTKPKQEKFVGVTPDRNDIKHLALQSIFGLKTIPVQENMKDIDFSRIGRKDFPGAPVFELNVTSTDRDDRLLEIVKTMVEFLHKFERFYRISLTSLFDDLAARYMIDALKSNEIADRFEHAMARPGFDSNNWEDIQSC
ncbi:hypothetical protein BGX26_008859, partial [Mortierella sp. AD094]